MRADHKILELTLLYIPDTQCRNKKPHTLLTVS